MNASSAVSPCRCRRAGDETMVVRNSSIGGGIGVGCSSMENLRAGDVGGSGCCSLRACRGKYQASDQGERAERHWGSATYGRLRKILFFPITVIGRPGGGASKYPKMTPTSSGVCAKKQRDICRLEVGPRQDSRVLHARFVAWVKNVANFRFCRSPRCCERPLRPPEL